MNQSVNPSLNQSVNSGSRENRKNGALIAMGLALILFGSSARAQAVNETHLTEKEIPLQQLVSAASFIGEKLTFLRPLRPLRLDQQGSLLVQRGLSVSSHQLEAEKPFCMLRAFDRERNLVKDSLTMPATTRIMHVTSIQNQAVQFNLQADELPESENLWILSCSKGYVITQKRKPRSDEVSVWYLYRQLADWIAPQFTQHVEGAGVPNYGEFKSVFKGQVLIEDRSSLGIE